MHICKDFGVNLNSCCNFSKYKKSICANVQGLSEYTHHLQQLHSVFWLALQA